MFWNQLLILLTILSKCLATDTYYLTIIEINNVVGVFGSTSNINDHSSNGYDESTGTFALKDTQGYSVNLYVNPSTDYGAFSFSKSGYSVFTHDDDGRIYADGNLVYFALCYDLSLIGTVPYYVYKSRMYYYHNVFPTGECSPVIMSFDNFLDKVAYVDDTAKIPYVGSGSSVVAASSSTSSSSSSSSSSTSSSTSSSSTSSSLSSSSSSSSTSIDTSSSTSSISGSSSSSSSSASTSTSALTISPSPKTASFSSSSSQTQSSSGAANYLHDVGSSFKFGILFALIL